MSNKIKITILLLLLIAVGIESFLLVNTLSEIKEIEEEKNRVATKNDSPVEPPIAPIVTINSAIDLSIYDDSVVAAAVNVARELVNKEIEAGVYLTDATVFDISRIDVQSNSLYYSFDMLKVEVLLTNNSGKKISNNSTYLMYYNRWDEDNKGRYFLGSITEDTIAKKYSDVSAEYNNDIYVAACEMEKYAYLKKNILTTEDELYLTACNKAIAYSQAFDISEVIVDTYTISNDANNRMYLFGNAVDDNMINVTFTYFDDVSGWAFLYATTTVID